MGRSRGANPHASASAARARSAPWRAEPGLERRQPAHVVQVSAGVTRSSSPDVRTRVVFSRWTVPGMASTRSRSRMSASAKAFSASFQVSPRAASSIAPRISGGTVTRAGPTSSSSRPLNAARDGSG